MPRLRTLSLLVAALLATASASAGRDKEMPPFPDELRPMIGTWQTTHLWKKKKLL